MTGSTGLAFQRCRQGWVRSLAERRLPRQVPVWEETILGVRERDREMEAPRGKDQGLLASSVALRTPVRWAGVMELGVGQLWETLGMERLRTQGCSGPHNGEMVREATARGCPAWEEGLDLLRGQAAMCWSLPERQAHRAAILREQAREALPEAVLREQAWESSRAFSQREPAREILRPSVHQPPETLRERGRLSGRQMVRKARWLKTPGRSNPG